MGPTLPFNTRSDGGCIHTQFYLLRCTRAPLQMQEGPIWRKGILASHTKPLSTWSKNKDESGGLNFNTSLQTWRCLCRCHLNPTITQGVWHPLENQPSRLKHAKILRCLIITFYVRDLQHLSHPAEQSTAQAGSPDSYPPCPLLPHNTNTSPVKRAPAAAFFASPFNKNDTWSSGMNAQTQWLALISLHTFKPIPPQRN